MALEQRTPTHKPDTRIDPLVFFGVLVVLFALTLPLALFPQQGAEIMARIKFVVTNDLGVFYLLLGVLAMGFVFYVSFSDIGKIKQ